MVHPEPNRAATLVQLAADRLAQDQPDWAQAMRAEVQHIHGRAERWRFAIGCMQVALLPPGGPGRFGPALRTVVAIAGLACVLAAMYASTRAPDRSIKMNAHDWQALGVLLLLCGLVTFALSRSRAPAARSAHQVALIAGIGIGLLTVIGSSPASPIGNLNMGGGPTVSPLGYATPRFGCVVIAAAVARGHRTTSVGVTASV
jgi:hypothetical protein